MKDINTLIMEFITRVLPDIGKEYYFFENHSGGLKKGVLVSISIDKGGISYCVRGKDAQYGVDNIVDNIFDTEAEAVEAFTAHLEALKIPEGGSHE